MPLPPTCPQGEAAPVPAADGASRVNGVRPVAHMIGYAHLDPVWLWQWTEGYAEARATLRSAVDRLREYPEFVFTFTSVVFLDWVAESDPALFAEIAERVAEGRFHLAGGWWVEADCNLPSGEALVRQGLYGQRFLAQHFGVIATVGGNPDSFGHAATLPQLLAGCGLDGYFFQRPEKHEADLPGAVFTWRGPDGTEIVASRIFRYCSEPYELAAHIRECLSGSPPATTAGTAMLFYGVGNHGGGPTRRNLDSLRRVHATSGTVDLLCSTPRAYLDAQRGRTLPVVPGELQYHARGCYAAHAGIKAWNRRAEAALADAEVWATIAAGAAGLAYPARELRHAWRQLLLNQFHDTLAGTAIESAYDDARNQIGEVLAIAQRATNAALGRITQQIGIPAEPDMQPLIVFNPHPWPVHTVVEYEVGGWAKRMDLVDEEERPVPLQWGTSEATIAEGRYRAVFSADLPPLGYRLHRLRLGPARHSHPPAPKPGVLENEYLVARIDPVGGRLVSLLRKESGVDVLAGSVGGHAVVVRDEADTWGHGRDRWDDEVGGFVVERVERIEHGPVRTVVRVTSRHGASTLVEDYRLGAGATWLDVAVTLDWRERRRMLKLRYPTAVTRATVTAEIAYGTIVRPADGSEEPMHRWVDVSGTVRGAAAGLAVANDGKYAYDARTAEDGTDLGITVARCIPYAHHDPAIVGDADRHRWLDAGEQRFTLRLIPHGGDWRAAEVERRAAELNRRPSCISDTYHGGERDGSGSFGTVDGAIIGGVVLKRAEAGDATIVRLAEAHGIGGPATVRLAFTGRVLTVELRPWQVLTIRVPDDPTSPPLTVDLCEWTPDERPPAQPTTDGRPRLPAGDR